MKFWFVFLVWITSVMFLSFYAFLKLRKTEDSQLNKKGLVLLALFWIVLGLVDLYQIEDSAQLWFRVLCNGILYAACLQDFISLYFGPGWILISALICLLYACLPDFLRWVSLAGASFCLISLPFIYKRWMGSADLVCLFVFGWIFGFNGVLKVVLCGCLLGMLYGKILKARLIPFISMLTLSCLLLEAAGVI